MSTVQGLGRTLCRKESISPTTPHSHSRPCYTKPQPDTNVRIRFVSVLLCTWVSAFYAYGCV